MITAAVAGASGYAGAEIVRLLLAHPEVEVGALTAAGNAGARVGDLAPHLAPVADRVLEPTTDEVLAGHDVVFLALPHGHSAAIAQALPAETVVVDCETGRFRMGLAADLARRMGAEHIPLEQVAASGLVEIVTDRTASRRSAA